LQTAHQGIHTNNYTESWHRLLKTSYLPPPDRLRIDEVVQILTDDVESHYRWSQNQVETGFAGQTSNKFQMRQKLIADSLTKDDMDILGINYTAITGGVRLLLIIDPNGVPS
jgi:alkyl hydroperoxide reductase subunit AhpC